MKGAAPRKVPVRMKAPLAVTAATGSGAAILTVESAGTHASYDRETSVEGGKTWFAIPSTTRTKTTAAALPVGTVGTAVQFRFRSLTPKGQSDWSQPTGLLVK